MIRLKGEKSYAQKMLGKAMAKGGMGFGSGQGPAKEERQGPMIKGKTDVRNEEDSDDSSDWDLDGDDEFEAMRETRLAQMKKTFERRQEFLSLGHGEYVEIAEEEFLTQVTKSKYCVVHFYKDEFERCKIYDMHLRKIAPKYIATKFMKLDAEKAPFFIGKLQVRVLPTIICFKDGIAKERIVGFEGLSGDEFKTQELERLLDAMDAVVVEDDHKAKDTRPTNGIRFSNINKTVYDSD